MKVNFFKQSKINQLYKDPLFDAIEDLINGNSSIVLGKYTKTFEKLYSQYIGSKYCIFLSNGLDALFLALKAVGIKKGDEIIVPNHTYIATWLSALHIGGTLVPVPVKEENLLIDEDSIETFITSKTKCIMPVHLYGNGTNFLKIKEIAKKYGLFVVDDAAQAHGTLINNKRVGNLFDISCFSFYPTKNLGALGEAGCITTNDKNFFNKISSLRNYGKSTDDSSLNLYAGFNSRGDELQAAFLLSKLRNLEKIIEKRKEILNIYSKLETSELKKYISLIKYNSSSSPHLAVIRLRNKFLRDSLMEFLHSCSVETMIHYKTPCHSQKFISLENIKIESNVALQSENIANTILSLPMTEAHDLDEIEYVVQCIFNFFDCYFKNLI